MTQILRPPLIIEAATRFLPSRFIRFLIKLSPDLRVSATSWFRTRGLNTEVGGVDLSQHLIGTALDVIGPDSDVLLDRASRAGLVVIRESDHGHIQLFPASLATEVVPILVQLANLA